MNIKRLLINLVLVAVAGFLVYMLSQTINRPIDFRETLKTREEAVRSKLLEIAHLQKMYKDLTGSYASSFDSLELILTTATFRIERVQGDKYDSTQVVTRDTVEMPSIDSLRNFIRSKREKDIDPKTYFQDLVVVPYSNGAAKFYVQSGMATVEGMDSLQQPSFEVSTPIGAYMQDYAERDYRLYDPDYSHDNLRKVGDINKPNKLSGNW